MVHSRLSSSHACVNEWTSGQVRSISISTRVLSGSNKWSKIRHKKGAKDLERGTVYSAISREILASKAKDNGVPKDRVNATLEKANGVAAGSMHSVTYEALGPPNKAGVPVALVIECLTDSVPRTLAKVKELMNRANARLSSTAHLFNRVGRMRILPGLADGSDSRRSFDQVFDVAVEAGATDVRVMEADEIDEELENTMSSEVGASSSDVLPIEIDCDPTELYALSQTLAGTDQVLSAETVLLSSGPPIRFRSEEEDAAHSDTTASDEDAAGYLNESDVEKLDKLLAALEDSADAQRVWSNLDGWPSR
ncbi:Uncharacterized conserved protein [Ceraceosorus bombacis]|uniref:Uncharacterized conserved protein n=1 Tax=Ceraceosorus bombacis TaxID=401625 RepID=A0A0N7L938_9BASI|nr:Uncharacterized conserved protein [Ceraceosorus bombacis]